MRTMLKEVTKTEHFFLNHSQGTDLLKVEYSDLPSGWHWRLRVNDQVTAWGNSRTDLLFLNGYCVASEYNDGFKPWTPFRITYTKENPP